MEARSSQKPQEKVPRVHRPYAFEKMEGLVRNMQDLENGVPVRSQKQFLTSIPSAFMGYDLIEWLIDRLQIDETEAVHLANQLLQYGYFFPVNDSKNLIFKDDSSLYRFQTPYYWPWQHRTPDNVEYAIYLAKRTLRNKQRHALEDYETEALNSLRKNLSNKWELIHMQAEEQVRLAKDLKKLDKVVSDSQERAFWRVYRPPPGFSSSLEIVPVPTRARPGGQTPVRKKTLSDMKREVELQRNSLTRTRIKVSVAIENLETYFKTYVEYDSMVVPPQPSNPWITDDHIFWQLNSPLVDIPTEKRVKRWGLSMEEIMSDPTGLLEFTNYLRKEYSHENIRFWMAVKDLKHCHQAHIPDKINEIFREFLAPGAPCEINIDGKTMEKVHQEMKNPSRFTFDSAAEHVYTLLLKKDCYPRFIRSDHYRSLIAAGIQPLQKKRFFVFGGQAKKKITSTLITSSNLQHGNASTSNRRRGSDRSLSGSAHELAVCGFRDITTIPRVPHSHSQSNLTNIPYRDGAVAGTLSTLRPMDDVCPWDDVQETSNITEQNVVAKTSSSTDEQINSPNRRITNERSSCTSRKNSTQLDSCSSSSDLSLAITEVSDGLKNTIGHQHLTSIATTNITKNYSLRSTVRVKLSNTTRASTYTCDYPSPQQSFEHPVLQLDVGRCVPEESENWSIEESASEGEGLKAPLISISAIASNSTGDSVESKKSEKFSVESGTLQTESKMTKVSDSVEDKEADDSREEAQVVPVWKPEVHNQEKPVDNDVSFAMASVPQEQRDNNVNEVCPWEDEENCTVEKPYVKTYATLGYL